MCGIIGVTGSDDSFRIVLDGLGLLEYRGYDSAGVVLVPARSGSADGEAGAPLWRRRAAVRAESIPALARIAATAPPARCGIGHTRWATHGAPTEENAHPHVDCSGRIAVVHNGIIENHRELAAKLDAEGHRRTSQTDTEVIAHLVEAEMAGGASLFEAVQRCVSLLRGDYALVLASTDEPEVLVATRRASPLIVGRTDSLGLVASDISALLDITRELYALKDDEVAEVRPGSIRLVDAKGAGVQPAPLHVTWGVRAAQREGYEDFMSKEIHEQPRALADTLLGRLLSEGTTELEELEIGAAELSDISRVVVIACGSSFHAGLVGRAAIESWAKLPCAVEIASEFRYRDPVIDHRTLVLAISQSGETVDTLHALREAQRRGARTIVLTNVVDSLMAREADGVIYTRAGPEIGVASTKCHTAQIVLLQVFALHLAALRGTLDAGAVAALGEQIRALPGLVEDAVRRFDEYRKTAEQLAHVNDVFFLGRGPGYPVALEGALKLKELAYVRAEGYPAGEMKHGPISLIDRDAVVVVVANKGALSAKLLANVEEVRARGATVVALCDAGDAEVAALADMVLEVPHVEEMVAASVLVVPLQILAYGVARARGNDVDRPRNLAKVVTVE
ncbi:MAG TPA: glutamine--fructose-6-phosphate transaminase (isomerizing) [Acidimicrobiales bacterium]|nr:glutamine--fructose-6-phosphate transaminase (isomerizing) [Acidimicrobiales bacterium]